MKIVLITNANKFAIYQECSIPVGQVTNSHQEATNFSARFTLRIFIELV